MIRFLQTPGTFKKVALGGILVFFSVAMVIQLIPGGLGEAFGFSGGTNQAGVLAQIGDQQVTTQEIEARAEQIRAQRNYPQQLMPYIREQAADGLVTRKVLLVEADRMGLKATDQDVQAELHSGALGQQLFPKGEFIGEAGYEQVVSQYFRMSVAQFEQMVREELLLRKLNGLVMDGVVVSPDDIKAAYLRDKTKVKLEYAVLSAEDLMKQVNPGEEELKAYFERNQARYKDTIPETRKAKYVVVDSDKVAEKMPVTQQDLQRFYNENKDQFRVPDEVNARHILVRTPLPGPDGKTDPKAVDDARKKAEDILKQVKAGGDFATLAKKYSDDEGTKEKGGELGWFQRGRMVKEFEQAAFALDKGQTSGVVQSSFGFHIIRLDDKHAAHLRSFDEMKSQIEPVVKRQKAQKDAEQLADTLQAQARTTTLEQAAAKSGFAVTTTDFVKRTDQLPGIGPSPDFMERLFSASESSPPAVAPLQQGFVVYQVTGIKPPQTPSFEHIRARVENDLKRERSQQMLVQKVQELSDRARAEHDLRKAAKEIGATVKTSESVGPDGQVPNIGSMSGPAAVAFSMKPGEISGPVRGSTGEGIVLTVTQREEPSLANLDKSQEEVREKLLQDKRQIVLQNFATSLRERMDKEGKIRWNKDERTRLFNPKLGGAGM